MIKNEENIQSLNQFQAGLYTSFPTMPDECLSIINSLSANQSARSVVRLSQSPFHPRGHGSLYQALSGLISDEKSWLSMYRSQQQLIGQYLPQPIERAYWLFSIDVTSNFRPSSRCVPDCQRVRGAGGLGVGHQYSLVCYLPELSEPSSWAVPLAIERADSESNKEELGMSQLKQLLSDEQQPFHKQLCVSVQDRAYTSVKVVASGLAEKNWVQITRLRTNRVVYAQPEKPEQPKRGRPFRYGQKFKLSEVQLWQEQTPPDETLILEEKTARGRVRQHRVALWHNRLLRNKQGARIHDKPFTLVQSICYNEQGKQLYRRPIWLAVHGERRTEIPTAELLPDYLQRGKPEHLHKFAKEHLLAGQFQGIDPQREQAWWWMTGLAYVQLFLAQPLVKPVRLPWEKERPQEAPLPPSWVQRGFGAIMALLDNPVKPPKRRGNSSGRPKGKKSSPKRRAALVKKNKKPPKKGK